MLFQGLEQTLESRYNIKINDIDWEDVEGYLIAELEAILDVKITSHKEITDALNRIKKLYPNEFLKLIDKLKSKMRSIKDPLKNKSSTKQTKSWDKEDPDKDSKRGDSGRKSRKKKKKKLDPEYIYN